MPWSYILTFVAGLVLGAVFMFLLIAIRVEQILKGGN